MQRAERVDLVVARAVCALVAPRESHAERRRDRGECLPLRPRPREIRPRNDTTTPAFVLRILAREPGLPDASRPP